MMVLLPLLQWRLWRRLIRRLQMRLSAGQVLLW
jgi:hypothetical protein